MSRPPVGRSKHQKEIDRAAKREGKAQRLAARRAARAADTDTTRVETDRDDPAVVT